MTTKYLFLDMDGVLNSHQSIVLGDKVRTWPEPPTASYADVNAMINDLGAINVNMFRYMLSKIPDLCVVISSTWRSVYSPTSFNEMFACLYIPINIIGKTGHYMTSGLYKRGVEIQDFARDNNIKLEDAVILDDNPVFSPNEPWFSRLVATDSLVGLTYADVLKVMDLINPEFVPACILM